MFSLNYFFFPTLVLCKIPAYFGNRNKIRRATRSSPFQREELPKKSKVLPLYFLSALLKSKQDSPAWRMYWKFSTDEGAAPEIPIRTMNGKCRQRLLECSWSLSAYKKKNGLGNIYVYIYYTHIYYQHMGGGHTDRQRLRHLRRPNMQ